MTDKPLISNSELSYVISITMPTPTIRIKIPKVFVKAMQRRNSVRNNDTESSGKSKKKKKGFRKKVGAIFSNVFGNKKSSLSSSLPKKVCSNGDNGDVNGNGDDGRDEKNQRKELKYVVDGSVEKRLVKSNRKVRSVKGLNGSRVVEERAIATGFGVSKSLLANEKVVAAAGEEGKEVGKPKATAVAKVHSKRTNGLELKKRKGNEADDRSAAEDASLSIFVAGDKNPNAVGTRSRRVNGKQQEKCSELNKAPSRTATTTTNTTTTRRRKLKIAWSMKKMMGGEVEEQELCKKRILMGGRCRPLGTIQYDENGYLLPEV